MKLQFLGNKLISSPDLETDATVCSAKINLMLPPVSHQTCAAFTVAKVKNKLITTRLSQQSLRSLLLYQCPVSWHELHQCTRVLVLYPRLSKTRMHWDKSKKNTFRDKAEPRPRPSKPIWQKWDVCKSFKVPYAKFVQLNSYKKNPCIYSKASDMSKIILDSWKLDVHL